MKSLELINKLNEDPALRMSQGITAGKLADRMQTLIERWASSIGMPSFSSRTLESRPRLRKMDGESFVLTDVLEESE